MRLPQSQSHFYSYLKDSIGSLSEARFAGRCDQRVRRWETQEKQVGRHRCGYDSSAAEGEQRRLRYAATKKLVQFTNRPE